MTQEGFYDPNTYNQQGSNQYDMNTQQNGSEFGVFDYSENQSPESYPPQQDQTLKQTQQQGLYNPAGYTGGIYNPADQQAYNQQPSATEDDEDYENEPPLLEELGINFDHIYQKTLAVLNPMKSAEADVVQDSDLAGPLVFCLAFGATLLLTGKIQFGYIYGLGVFGSLGMYFLLNLMSLTGVSITCVISILGYCLLPMVILSSAAILVLLSGILGSVLSGLTVMWCSFSASKLFVSALQMDGQQLLIAYPCALVYAVFALLTVF